MVSFTQMSYTTNESSIIDVCAELSNVLLPGGTAEEITVTLSAVNGTAGMRIADSTRCCACFSTQCNYSIISVFGLDFVQPESPTALSFAAGSVEGAMDCVTVTPVDDDVLEGDQQFAVFLSAPTGGANLAAPSMADVVIIDDEG